jgi:hypothetical protein
MEIRGDAKRHSGRARNANCSFRSFLDREPTKESKI